MPKQKFDSAKFLGFVEQVSEQIGGGTGGLIEQYGKSVTKFHKLNGFDPFDNKGFEKRKALMTRAEIKLIAAIGGNLTPVIDKALSLIDKAEQLSIKQK